MKAFLLTAGLFSACAGFTQTTSLPLADNRDNSDTVMKNYGGVRPYIVRNYRKYSGMPNAIVVTPLLTQKKGNNRNGFDLYELQQDKMICLVPDSSNISNMPVLGYQPPRVPKASPDVKIIH